MDVRDESAFSRSRLSTIDGRDEVTRNMAPLPPPGWHGAPVQQSREFAPMPQTGNMRALEGIFQDMSPVDGQELPVDAVYRHGTPGEDKSGDEASRPDQMYHDLHNKISSRSFNSRLAMTLMAVTEVVKDHLWMNVAHVVKGGSVGKGTAIVGCTDAEVVFFVYGLPTTRHAKWLPPLLKAVSSVLQLHVPPSHGNDISQTSTSVQLKCKNGVTVDLRFSPVFETFADTVNALAAATPQARKFFEPAFVREQVLFVSKQAGSVKMTIRLLKWWREQQAWSSPLCRPSDYLLELIGIYVHQQTKPKDQAQAIANVMHLLSRFDELRVVWTHQYRKSDVWSPLLLQRPLLMDPVNPFVNVADPQTLDPRELMALAAKTHFFW